MHWLYSLSASSLVFCGCSSTNGLKDEGGGGNGSGGRTSFRACSKIAFGVPPLSGNAPEPRSERGTPNLRLRISVGFFRYALRIGAGTKKANFRLPLMGQ